MVRPQMSSWWDAASHFAESASQHLWPWVCPEELVQAQPSEQPQSPGPRHNLPLPPRAGEGCIHKDMRLTLPTPESQQASPLHREGA